MFVEFEASNGGKVCLKVDQIVSVELVGSSDSGSLCNIFTTDARVTKIKGDYEKVMDKLRTHIVTQQPSLHPILGE